MLLANIFRYFFNERYAKKTVNINNYIHKLQINKDLYNEEYLKLTTLIKDHYKLDTLIYKHQEIGRDTSLINEILKFSPIAITHNLEAFENIFSISNSENSVKRWQDFIVTVNHLLHPDFIDISIGRYFKQILEVNYSQQEGQVPYETMNNIIYQYNHLKWTWILIPYQQTTMLINPPKETK